MTLKNNIFLGFLFASLMGISLSSTSLRVRAEGEENDDNIVKAILYDSDGERTEIKEKTTLIPDGEITRYTDEAPGSLWSIFNHGDAMRGTITYNSSLGAYNDYTVAHAQSNASEPINTMVVSCRAYYKNQYGGEGSLVGDKSKTNPLGTTVMALSVDVEVLPSPVFSFEIFSAYSVHDYYCDGHTDVHRALVWSQN